MKNGDQWRLNRIKPEHKKQLLKVVPFGTISAL
jgi:hypothetical protein